MAFCMTHCSWIMHGPEFDFSNIGKMKVHLGNERIDYNWIICWILTARIFFLSWYDFLHCSEAMNLFCGVLNGWWETLEITLISPFLFVKSQACFLACQVVPPAPVAGHPTAGLAHSSQPLSLSCHLPVHSRNEFLDTIPPTHMFRYIVTKIF